MWLTHCCMYHRHRRHIAVIRYLLSKWRRRWGRPFLFLVISRFVVLVVVGVGFLFKSLRVISFVMCVRCQHHPCLLGLSGWSGNGISSRSRTWANAICSSSSAKRLPMQLRLPKPKGRDANGWGAGPSPSHRAGLKELGSRNWAGSLEVA